MNNMCSIDDCQKSACGRLWQGKAYCSAHYNEMFTSEFDSEYVCWNSDTKPSHRLRSLFGRFVDEKWAIRESSLSKARIRDRAFNFQKGDSGFTFEITRHPGAFANPDYYPTNRIVQQWRVSWEATVFSGIAECIGERPWTSADPD